jgi:drug/metabolite transporter (DMT)-like permease
MRLVPVWLGAIAVIGGIAVSASNVTGRGSVWVGILVALAAAAGYALANTSASVAYHGGSNALTVAATRFLVPTAGLIGWLHLGGVSLVLPKRDAVVSALLGVATALYTWALLKSFSSIPFALAVLIFYLFPLIAAAIVAVLGWERFTWQTGAATLLALVGLALALDIRSGNLNALGVALAFVAALGLAVVIVVSSRIIGKGDARPPTLYMAAAASALLLVLCAASGDFALPNSPSGWLGFIAAAGFYGFAMIAFFIALPMIGPVRASLLSYADAVISAGLGVIVLGQTLTLLQVVGIALVIVALVGATLPR